MAFMSTPTVHLWFGRTVAPENRATEHYRKSGIARPNRDANLQSDNVTEP